MVHRTPCKQSRTLNSRTGSEVFLKLENLQKTGSFKVRGAFNKISKLPDDACAQGIICASAGNHAQGVAMAGREKGVPVSVFMPEGTPEAKVLATRQYGAVVKITGRNFDEAYAAAKKEQLRSGAVFIHPFDDLAVIEGQATVALEMLQQCPALDTIVVPAGGGGLLAGTALAVKTLRPEVRVVGVQAEAASAIASAFHGSDTFPALFLPTIAEGIRVKEPGELTTRIIRSLVDDMIVVSEQEIASAILFMLEREKMLVEGAGATAVAAVLHSHMPFKSARTGIIVSGGNLDISKLEACRKIAASINQVSSY
ncbi:pyridoxal-phosphate dependent enzyme [Planomicrobium sp. YIM 101495]|nr:pyridoxal-phosphate dependent enzyme [Planomicrobium sp. YIM 101495]